MERLTSTGSVTEVEALGPGDHLFFADWLGDADQKVRDDGPTVGELVPCRRGARRGRQGTHVAVVSQQAPVQRGAESPSRRSDRTCRRRGAAGSAGGIGGSHHQRLVAASASRCARIGRRVHRRHRSVHSRRDDECHRGDPQAVRMSSGYGEHPPWHDVQLQLRGPVVGALDTTFRERWTAPTPLISSIRWRRCATRFLGPDSARRPLPEQPPDPPRLRVACGAGATDLR